MLKICPKNCIGIVSTKKLCLYGIIMDGLYGNIATCMEPHNQPEMGHFRRKGTRLASCKHALTTHCTPWTNKKGVKSNNFSLEAQKVWRRETTFRLVIMIMHGCLLY